MSKNHLSLAFVALLLGSADANAAAPYTSAGLPNCTFQNALFVDDNGWQMTFAASSGDGIGIEVMVRPIDDGPVLTGSIRGAADGGGMELRITSCHRDKCEYSVPFLGLDADSRHQLVAVTPQASLTQSVPAMIVTPGLGTRLEKQSVKDLSEVENFPGHLWKYKRCGVDPTGPFFASGELELHGDHWIDLDRGIETKEPTDGSDFFWWYGDPGDRSFSNGTSVSALGLGDGIGRDFAGCDATEFGGGISERALGAGTAACFRTDEGRLGAMRLTLLPQGSLGIKYWIWSRRPGTAAAPLKIGACSRTSISYIDSYFVGMPESGSSVYFANGLYQVSFQDVVPDIHNSRVGDPVRICLVDKIKDCPPADDRGTVYKTMNLRTGKTWILSNSWHLCGGA